MLHPLKRLTHLSEPYRTIVCASLAALIILIVTAYSYQLQQTQQHQEIINQYGKRIVNVSSEQMASSLFNEDAISLQAMSQRLVEQASVISVIVYDIDNSIISQANGQDINFYQQDVVMYTSPIVSSDNIIGSITIGIVPSLFHAAKTNTVSVILAIALTIIAIIALIKGLLSPPALPNTQDKTSTSTENHHTTSHSLPTQITQEKSEEEITAIYLTIHIQNSVILYKQLNAEMRIHQLELLEQKIHQAITLYNGSILLTNEHSITLSFNSPHSHNLLNAVYSNELISKLNESETESVIVLNGFIQGENNASSLCYSLQQARTNIQEENQHTLHIHRQLFEQHDLSDHIDIDDSLPISKAIKIKGLRGKYRTLLENQLQKLS